MNSTGLFNLVLLQKIKFLENSDITLYCILKTTYNLVPPSPLQEMGGEHLIFCSKFKDKAFKRNN